MLRSAPVIQGKISRSRCALRCVWMDTMSTGIVTLSWLGFQDTTRILFVLRIPVEGIKMKVTPFGEFR